MAGENTEPDPDLEAGPHDPFEAELVAYLDGELDGEAARRVEARLASDPAARARAAALKKSFDLLDYLPRPEPSPTFTTRTLDKLPAVKSGPVLVPSGRPQPASHPSTPGLPSTSLPMALSESGPASPRRSAPRWAKVVGGCAAAVALALVGYGSMAALKPFSSGTPKPPDEPPEPDARVVENLPLYAVADDLEFVQELARTEFFGDEPAVSYDPALRPHPPSDTADKPTARQYEGLLKAFRALPAARQAEVVKLDRDLHAREPAEFDRLFRSLEAYAVWLDRLPEPERRGVLTAATPKLRLGVVHAIRERQWTEALPPPLKKQLDALTNPAEKGKLVQQWKEEEEARRERWALVRQHADAFAAYKSPWPFDTEDGGRAVREFARVAFKVPDKFDPKSDDLRRCRLSPEELGAYRMALQQGERDGVWVWYGLVVYELAKNHPYLPEPADPKQQITEFSELPSPLGASKKLSNRVMRFAGKWPDFPLEVHKELPALKLAAFQTLGPAKVEQFKEPVREFWRKDLSPKLTGDERLALQRLEGRWPEYPREFVRLSVKYDLSVPGVTLPGSPKRWAETYSVRPQGRSGDRDKPDKTKDRDGER
ncbi:MAG: hypothetical protein K2V38_07340 [Gemmataceae bacterium]|nr:hypothetical protein [Gemmataceae bacterium]